MSSEFSQARISPLARAMPLLMGTVLISGWQRTTQIEDQIAIALLVNREVGIKVIVEQGLLLKLVEGGDQEIVHACSPPQEILFEILHAAAAQLIQAEFTSRRPVLNIAPAIEGEQVAVALHQADGLAIRGQRLA